MSALRKENGNGLEIVSPIPKPNGKLLDALGNTVSPAKPTLMARIDEKATQQITLSRGTIWLVATGLVLAGVIFSYGSSFVAWSRDDEGQRVKMANIERQVEELNKKFDAFNDAAITQRIKDAEKRGYELKAAEGDHK